MNYLIGISLFFFLVNPSFAQKKYIDPSVKEKRGLLEEANSVASDSVEKTAETTTMVKEKDPQELLCDCVTLMNMNKHLSNRYYTLSKIDRAEIDTDEINTREGNVESTMSFIIHKYKKMKPPVTRKKCIGLEVNENNVSKLVSMIEMQEKKCDVYKIRGIPSEE